jgi:hypothetical protein
MMHGGHRRAIDRYFAGRLGAAAEARMRTRVERCEQCRALYERHLVVEAALSAGGGTATDRLWRSIQLGSGLSLDADARATQGTAASAARPAALLAPRRRLALGGAALGAAAILLVALPRLGTRPDRAPTPGEPVARGGGAAVPAPALHVFRSVSAHAAEPLSDGAAIHAREGLLFAYSNFDAALTHLMIFAVDAGYGVHWYYPAFLRAGENPAASPVVASGTGIELGEEIRHDLPAGPLRVTALFLREPHRVLEIEDLVHAQLAEPRRPLDTAVPWLIPGAVEVSTMLRVVP